MLLFDVVWKVLTTVLGHLVAPVTIVNSKHTLSRHVTENVIVCVLVKIIDYGSQDQVLHSAVGWIRSMRVQYFQTPRILEKLYILLFIPPPMGGRNITRGKKYGDNE